MPNPRRRRQPGPSGESSPDTRQPGQPAPSGDGLDVAALIQSLTLQLEEHTKRVEENVAAQLGRQSEQVASLVTREIDGLRGELGRTSRAAPLTTASLNEAAPRSPSGNHREGAVARSATGSCRAKASPYDGRTPWEDYRRQFEVVATVNGWSESERASMLTSMLRDRALAVLQNVPPEKQWDYDHLVSVLSLRFGSEHRTGLHRASLRNRTQRLSEELTEFAYELERLAKLSFPDCPAEIQDQMALMYFLDGVADAEVQKMLRYAAPKTLQEALTRALEVESVACLTRPGKKVREMTADVEEEEARRTTMERRPTEGWRRHSGRARCWRCGDPGHFLSACDQPAENRRTRDAATSPGPVRERPGNAH